MEENLLEDDEWSNLLRDFPMETNTSTLESDIEGMQTQRASPSTAKVTDPIKTPSEKAIHQCTSCEKTFTLKRNLTRHMKTHEINDIFKCEICEKSFQRTDNLKAHIKTHNVNNIFKCETCFKEFAQKRYLMAHLKIHDELKKNQDVRKYHCTECMQQFSKKFNLQQHLKTHHTVKKLISVKKRKYNTTPSKPRMQVEALNIFKTIFFHPEKQDSYDLHQFFDVNFNDICQTIDENLELKNSIKWHMIVKVIMERLSPEMETEINSAFFHTDTYIQLTNDNIAEQVHEGFSKIIQSFEKYLERGSGWKLREVLYLELKIATYNPLKGSSYIELPKKLSDKKAILNIENFNDQKCLLWCLLAHKHDIDITSNPQRVSHYIPYENELNMKGVKYPVPYQKIRKIETQNNLRINVFGYEEGEITLIFISDRTDRDVINLLLIANEDTQHYCLIKDFSRFLGHRTKHDGATYYCFRCFHGFIREDLLNEHTPHCKKRAAQIVKMPKPNDNILQFTGIHMQHPLAYTIYADFESLLEPLDNSTSTFDKDMPFTKKTSRHIPCGYAYIVVGPNGRCEKKIKTYRGTNVVTNFINDLIREKDEIESRLSQIKPMKLSSAEEKAFQEAEFCWICKRALCENRVRDHSHITGAYRGAAHANCNLNFKESKKICVIFHNLKNYDGHHIMTEMGKFTDHIIDVIANTLEKYISFMMHKPGSSAQLVFLDSFQFLPFSLEKLVANLDPSKFFLLNHHFPDEEENNLLRRKGIYPYNYFTSLDNFDEKQLPPPIAFFNTLTNESIQDEDYQHALTVWNKFDLKSLGEYHDLYVQTDVLLLADAFQNFRELSMKYYAIDPCHNYTTPGLSWQACLKMTEIKFELLTDINMQLFFEDGIRGGVSQISHRMATSNIPNTPEYNKDEATSYIMYWDANNLYGWAMWQSLPYGGFEWVEATQFNAQSIMQLKDDASEGFVFEVDLAYPHKLHPLHNDYPLAPERVTVTEEMLSPYAKSQLKGKKFVGTPKLIPNLNDKQNYIVHYRNLKLYIQLGMVLTAIHKVLKFNQAPWLRKYVDFNTEKRKQATSAFEKEFFKLLNNSFYGKSMENLRKRRMIQLCNNEERARKLVASPNYKNFKHFDNELVAVERKKPSIYMNRPMYVGFTILELSKYLMYDFHYNVIKKRYQNDIKMLFTDTDSLTYQIKTENIYHDMESMTSHFDFSEYPKNHPLYSETNKKTLGKFKDELCGARAIQFVGLKAKMYSLKSDIEEKKRAKGVSTRIVQNKLNHEDYVTCLLKQSTSYQTQTKILQENHHLYTVEQNKVCLSPFDDKRFLLSDGISSLAYGHRDIPNHV